MNRKRHLINFILFILTIGYVQSFIVLGKIKQFKNTVGKIRPFLGIGISVNDMKIPRCYSGWGSGKCVVKAFFRVCSLKLEGTSQHPEYGKDYQKALKEPSFIITRNMQTFDVNSDIFDCQPIGNVTLKYLHGIYHMISYPPVAYRDVMHSTKLHISVYIVFGFRKITTGPPTFYKLKSKDVFMMPLLDCDHSKFRDFDSIGKLNIKCEYNCGYNYYLEKCWYHCVNDTKQICICTEISGKMVCSVSCKSGFVKRWLHYETEPNKYESAPVCDVTDKCVSNPCGKNQLCFPINNATHLCENKFNYKIMDSGNRNITSNYFYVGDTFRLEIVGVSKKFYSYTSDIYIYLDPHSKAIREKILKPILRTKFKVNDLAKIDKTYKLIVKIYLEPWEKFLNFTLNFKVFRRIEKVKIIVNEGKTDESQQVGFYTPLSCHSHAKPDYRVLYFWLSDKDRLTNYVDLNTSIKSTPKITKTYSLKIKCRVYLVTTSSDPETLETELTITVQPNVLNSWDPFDNVFKKTTCADGSFVIKCAKNKSASTDIKIYQIYGKSKPKKLKDGIDLCLLKPDFYGFICYFKVRSSVLSRTVRFETTEEPTAACFQLITNIYGGFIQCHHNGHFSDTYETSLMLYDQEFDQRVASGMNYIRVPFKYILTKVLAICRVVYENEILLNTRIDYNTTIQMEPNYTYILTNETKKCMLNNRPKQFFPDGYILKGDKLLINQYVYSADVEKSITMYMLLLIALAVLYNSLPLLIFVTVIISDKTSYSTMLKIARKYRLKLTRSTINRRLHEEFLKCRDLQTTNPVFKQSFVYKFFQN